MPLLDIRNLSVDFATASGQFRAVDGVDVSVDTGEILAIVGESGSGKSVSMLAMMGLLPWTATVTADVMSFNGQDLRGLSPRQRRDIVGKDMAMIFQEPMSSLNPCFTAGFQIKEALRLHLGLDKKERHDRAVELFEMVGIPAPEDRLKAFPHQLSGGMNQRVMIAMAIACNPKLLIADEPTTALDVTIQAQILDLLTGLQKDTGMALILITHDMGVVAETAERVQVQYAGQKVEEQPVADLFETPHHPYTAALLAALPERATSRHLPTIPGVVPGQFDRPKGCLFSPRCKYADDRCREQPPAPAGTELGVARCHYPLSAKAEAEA
ncbi:ABC transporter ATP-binding protein [Defluviimonas sp. D31]|uniref:ABC transporter ATP-binding protein n=2 Tax=Albidovulum TaxID=205889 RepID=A0ABT3J0V1_9RHOB|nr:MULTISPECIES: ABC transporter ATP-binding protein [Defluviimonas]MCU9847021.1 ABC transporter ATP-binding protein [Defluviimonas sp. WL0024]MCW3781281.1 ABC transporter ATP-binding protein [Defluviimonas salinarum]MDW4548007.1 ABC transporter ATP-binding protein [Defluviimonas sp. D31]